MASFNKPGDEEDNEDDNDSDDGNANVDSASPSPFATSGLKRHEDVLGNSRLYGCLPHVGTLPATVKSWF